MPIYFLHLRDGEDLLLDEGGNSFPDHDAMVQAVLRTARSMIGHEAMAGAINLGQRIEVEDERNRIVHALAFRDAVRITDVAPDRP